MKLTVIGQCGMCTHGTIVYPDRQSLCNMTWHMSSSVEGYRKVEMLAKGPR